MNIAAQVTMPIPLSQVTKSLSLLRFSSLFIKASILLSAFLIFDSIAFIESWVPFLSSIYSFLPRNLLASFVWLLITLEGFYQSGPHPIEQLQSSQNLFPLWFPLFKPIGIAHSIFNNLRRASTSSFLPSLQNLKII